MTACEGRFVITFNGEIYNCPALRKELESDGARLFTTSDTEVLLHLYARFGEDMVHRLRGMFAFAIWDDATRSLFLARDPYGIKPLYTAVSGGTFRFASQVKALLAGMRLSRDVDPAGLVGFRLFGSVPEPFTLYREIAALPAGHVQRIDAKGAHAPQPFARLAAVLAAGARTREAADDLCERVRAGVRDSVRSHLLADVEVGAFLSAGVDSGALVGLMADAGQRDIRALTVSFAEFYGTAEDEGPLAAQSASSYRVQHIIRRVDAREFQNDLPALLAAMDQPSIDGVNTWFVAKAAREAGLKVAISGIGGDELFAGYSSFQDLPRWRRRYGPFAAVPGAGRVARALLRLLAPGLARNRPKALGVLDYAHGWAGAYLLRRGLFLPHELRQLIDTDIVREGMRRLDPLRRLSDSLWPDPGTDVGRVCALESAHYLRNQLLRDADWAGMAHGVEIRVPLVDIVLLRFLAPIIPAFAAGAGKTALAQAPSLSPPAEVVLRPKTGFAVPIRSWLNGSRGESKDSRPLSKGESSRRWSHVVLGALTQNNSRVDRAGEYQRQ